MIRNRIKSHRRVRAGDLIPHERNFRGHPDEQRQALAALYRDIGFARSLLAYETARRPAQADRRPPAPRHGPRHGGGRGDPRRER